MSQLKQHEQRNPGVRKFHVKRIIWRINSGLARGVTLDQMIQTLAPEYGMSPEALQQRIRRCGGKLRKALIVP